MSDIPFDKLVQILPDQSLINLKQLITQEQTRRQPAQKGQYRTANNPHLITPEAREQANDQARLRLIANYLDDINQGHVVVMYEMEEGEIEFLDGLRDIFDSKTVNDVAILMSRLPDGGLTGEAHVIFPNDAVAKSFLCLPVYKRVSALILPIVD